MARFIASQRDAHGIPQAVSCRALGVSQSWLYKWKGGQLPPRAARRERLKAEIARLFAEREGKDGSPRITAALRDDGWRVSENTVAALMREQGLAARRRRRRRVTTRPGRGRWRAPDLVKRKFAAGGLNRRWYGARACSPAICLLLLPFHTWAVAVLASVSALAVMPPGRPEDATTATAVPA